MSGSTVSRGFIRASAAPLRELQERDVEEESRVINQEPLRVSTGMSQ